MGLPRASRIHPGFRRAGTPRTIRGYAPRVLPGLGADVKLWACETGAMRRKKRAFGNSKEPPLARPSLCRCDPGQVRARRLGAGYGTGDPVQDAYVRATAG